MEINDKNIFRKISEGSEDAFKAVFNEYYSRLVVFAQNYIDNFEDAEEIVQQLFYSLWLKKDKLKIELSVKAYLYNAVRNNCYDYLKHQKVKSLYARRINQETKSQNIKFHNELISKETAKIILDAIESLPEKTKKIFKMNRFDGLKYKEIAEALEISPKTVENQMGTALKKLRNLLKNYIHLKKEVIK